MFITFGGWVGYFMGSKHQYGVQHGCKKNNGKSSDAVRLTIIPGASIACLTRILLYIYIYSRDDDIILSDRVKYNMTLFNASCVPTAREKITNLKF